MLLPGVPVVGVEEALCPVSDVPLVDPAAVPEEAVLDPVLLPLLLEPVDAVLFDGDVPPVDSVVVLSVEVPELVVSVGLVLLLVPWVEACCPAVLVVPLLIDVVGVVLDVPAAIAGAAPSAITQAALSSNFVVCPFAM